MKTFYLTDSGKVRSHNEDSVIITKNQSGDYLMIFEKDRPSKYCGNCYYLYIKRIELEYMDGTKEVADLEWKSENMMISLGTTKCDEVWTPLINQLKDYYPDFFSRNNV